MRPWAARIATLGHLRRRGTPDVQDGPPAHQDGEDLLFRPAATGFTVAVASRVSDASVTEAAAAVLHAMTTVESNDASRLLFSVGHALGEIVTERDVSWLLLCADALVAAVEDE